MIGDAANVPASKAGSVTHFEGETLVENIRRFLAGERAGGGFDGHANCFIETGFHKALLIDFNYDTEPLPGHYPSRTSALPLLKESRLNHLGKLMFQWVYWHGLLPGRDIPGIGSTCRRRQAPAPTKESTDDDHRRPSPAPTSTSTTKASSSTPSSGPRRWPPSSPAPTASTS